MIRGITIALIERLSDALRALAIGRKIARLQLTPVGQYSGACAAFPRLRNESMAPIMREAGIRLE